VMRQAKAHGVRRFLYASSASVYGIKHVPDVVEDLELEPITQYARCKAEGEQILWGLLDDAFCGVAVRAATVCGWSPRLRLDLTINILTMHALQHERIRVFGGTQLRPNIHVRDLVDFYAMLLRAERTAVQGQAFNVSRANASVMELAHMIKETLGNEVIEIVTEPTDDLRSYHLSAAKAKERLGYAPERPLAQAVRDLEEALAAGDIPEPSDSIYRNVALMRERPDFWAMNG
jgi:nucleoside-diphosphate-sugar epimerase